MKLLNISLNVVRNEVEWDKYVGPEYRKQHKYEDAKSSLPWFVVGFDCVKSDVSEDENKVTLFIEGADFTACGSDFDTNGFAVDSSDKQKLIIDLVRNDQGLMFDADTDCKIATIPSEFKVTVTDAFGTVFKASQSIMDFSDKDKILKEIDERCLQSGDKYLAKLIYELIAQDKI